eukprot:265312-Prymnesium_polylepis.1
MAAQQPAQPAQPNVVFLVVESTDGRTWQRGYQGGVIPLPNIRQLQEHGVAFERHYANAPVCCPSRATFWSGRHAHKITHASPIPGSDIRVRGAWNNYEGLPPDFDQRLDQVLTSEGYNTKVLGKRDWTAGSHTLNVRLNSWTMYTHFPYNITANGGWTDETDCKGNGSVSKGGGPRGNGTVHDDDWSVVREGLEWLPQAAQGPQPFFLYQGMTIVHPPYRTNEPCPEPSLTSQPKRADLGPDRGSQFWYSRIDPALIEVPRWLALDEMHPCDLQSSMLKGCIGSAADRAEMESESRRRNIRRIYYAMVAEFDDMVGAYMDGVKAAGAWNNTVWIVTSDHGDMQMEHRQFYKMSPRDPSASVPMVVFDGRPGRPLPSPKVVDEPTQLIDIFPTRYQPARARPAAQAHAIALVLPAFDGGGGERAKFAGARVRRRRAGALAHAGRLLASAAHGTHGRRFGAPSRHAGAAFVCDEPVPWVQPGGELVPDRAEGGCHPL